jgi:hypothetical protein
MNNTYSTMMSGIPAAVGIWLGLIGVSVLAFALLAAIAGRGRRRPQPVAARPTTEPVTEPVNEQPLAEPVAEPAPEPPTVPVAAGIAFRSAAMRRALAAAKATTTETGPAVEVAETSASDEQRFAEELATAAARAGVTADKRQAEWESAQRAVDTAWQAYEEAEVVATRAIRAAAFPVPATPLTPAEFADRERYLHRAAQAAQARGELSTDQLIDALSHRNGFDPRLHPFEQDALLRRLGRDRMLRAFKDAGERERTAWRAAEQAQAARRSLDREAAAAALNVAPGPEPASASRHIRVTTPVLSLR